MEASNPRRMPMGLPLLAQKAREKWGTHMRPQASQRFAALAGASQTRSEAAGPRETVPAGVLRVRVWS